MVFTFFVWYSLDHVCCSTTPQKNRQFLNLFVRGKTINYLINKSTTLIKKTDQNNTNKEFKVNRKRITALLTFFCANNPDWKNKGIFQLIKEYHNKSITTNQLKVLKLTKKHFIHYQRIRFHQI